MDGDLDVAVVDLGLPDAGAKRVLTKDASIEEIVDAVRRLDAGEPALTSG